MDQKFKQDGSSRPYYLLKWRTYGNSVNTMKEQLVELLIKIGLFFANCDGNYDPREKKFIHNFLRNLELNHILVPGDYDKEALEDVAPGNIDSVIADMKSFVNKLHEEEKELFMDLIDDYIQGIIKADNIIDSHETYYYNMWKDNFK